MHLRSEFKMRWRNVGALAFLFISLSCAYAIETHNHAPSSNTVIHHPTASLSIAGDLKDVKLKASIAQLVRALQHPSKLKETDRRSKLELVDKKSQPELITKHNTNVHSKDGRKLYYGAAIVPDAITISSQPIQIHSGANKTGGKRSRSLSSIDSEGVKTIEGIRVPDDEHDKHYTWRNARVIKGFLVPNDRSPNPHKKRQVLITDPQQYLAAAAAAQAQGATTIMDQSGRQAGQAVYSNSHHQIQQQQLQASQQAHAYMQQRQQDLGSGSTVYQTAGQPQSQQPVHQYQSAITSGQTTAFAYAPQPQQQGQMYVLQDGNSYVQYNPVQVSQAHQNQQSNQASQSQAQFYSRTGELPSSSATAQTPQVPSAVPQTASNAQNQQDIQKFQQQLAHAQNLQQAINNQQAQQPQTAHNQPQDTQQVQEPGQSVQQVQQQPQSIQTQQSQQSQFVPHGAEVNHQAQQVQEILAAASAASGGQYFQVQNQAPEQGPGSQVYQLSGQNSFAERQSPIAYQTTQNGFVIQPQTYVAGPGGQAFTIPIPVPSDQVQSAQRRDDPGQNQRTEYYQQQQSHNQHNHNHQGDRNNLGNRIMNSIHINKKALDRMDTTTAVVPALASTGILLGLSALAAGWYLSRANREVGIVRRTGKPASGSNRTRRDLGAIPTSNYPQQEVDQATFFQSIIQQSLEKTQQQYEDPVEPAYNNQQQEPVYNREPEPEQRPSNNRPKYSRRERPSRPQHRNDDDDYESNSKISKTQYAQEKSGALTVASSKNFAKVFIPALILGLSVISITALIFGWYVTGANREIAFLEPQSYSTQHRRKRSLLSSTALSDGWLQKTITAIHGNPYDRMPAPTSKSLLPHPFMDRETSKTNDLEFKISNTGLTGVLAGGALIAIIAFGLANSFSETGSRQHKTGRANPSSFSNNNQNALKHVRPPRAIDSTNDLNEGHPDNPGFLAAILSNIDVTQNSIMNKLQEAGKWQESPCAKRIFCDVMSTQDDDTIRVMEKRMATYINMLPESMSKKLSQTFSDVVSSIYKRDCSAFTCGGHRVDSSTIHQPSSPVTKPR